MARAASSTPAGTCNIVFRILILSPYGNQSLSGYPAARATGARAAELLE